MNRGILSGRSLAMLVLALFATGVIAGEPTVTGAWAKATAPGQDSASVYLHISVRKDARLVAVGSPAAKHVEIHVMKHESGMMMMRQAEDLALPANKEVVLGSGSHLMLVGLKQPLKPGDRIQLALTVEYADKHRETITVTAEVRPLTSSHDMQDMHDMGEHDMGSHGY
jgi:copper(I)-binding protein